jgi:5-methylcytosine-specific restriction endonuclease McrA
MSKLKEDIQKKIKELEARKAARTKRKRRSTKLVSAPPKKRPKAKKKPRRRAPRKTVKKTGAKPVLRRRPRDYEEAKALYGTTWYSDWRQYVLARDKSTCQMCGQVGGRLEVHHIRPKYLYPELTLEKKNGIALCRTCHQNRVTKHERKFYFIFDRIVALNS